MFVGQFGDAGLQFADAPRSEALGHQGSKSQVAWVVHCEKGHGPVGSGVRETGSRETSSRLDNAVLLRKSFQHIGMS